MLAIIVSRTHFYMGLIAAMVGIVGYGILNVFVQNRGLEAEDSLIASNAKLEKLVDLDGLTGIANRRAFDAALEREFAVALRTQKPISLLMIDVDFFKSLNDAKGHMTGDRYLVRIAGALRKALPRNSDLVARFGGEEFAVILPATEGAGAKIAGEKVRKAVADLRLSHPASDFGTITVSVGVATFDGSTPGSTVGLTETADNALYTAKRQGRNLTVFGRMVLSCGAPGQSAQARKAGDPIVTQSPRQ
jgi:diguanylate cyclase (GGDEF)-like protein